MERVTIKRAIETTGAAWELALLSGDTDVADALCHKLCAMERILDGRRSIYCGATSVERELAPAKRSAPARRDSSVWNQRFAELISGR